MRHHIIVIAAAAAALALASCGEPQFKVKGTVEGADNELLLLEKSDFHGRWIAVDSVRTSGSGAFSISSDAPASPDIYRLSLGDRFIYFPVDSIETITLNSSAKSYGSDFTISGTPGAEHLAAFEKELLKANLKDSASFSNFKRDVYTKYIKDDRASIVSYYILTKFVDNKPLYDPYDHQDSKYYAAVATQYENYHPNDPHGRMVKEVSLEAMKRRNAAQGKQTVMEAKELNVIDIALPDEKGNVKKLSDVVGKGKKTVVIFSLMLDRESPAFNRELARIYNSHSGAVEFYHVSFDAAQYEWRDAAKNLPWITVLDPNGTASTSLVDYNVATLPAVFVYSASGELTDRPESLRDLEKKL